MIIGQRIKELRIKNNISQQELGNKIGVSKVSISGYEKGTKKPTIEKLTEIANYFGITTDYLLGREKRTYNEETNIFIGYISEQDIELINELKHYPILYNKIIKDINKSIKTINSKIK